MQEDRKRYPTIPEKAWWTLRERFKKAIPARVDPAYLASVLGVTPHSAQVNILPALKVMGILDPEGKPTDLAVKWRDDDQYPKVCATIRERVYPRELLDVAPTAGDRKEAERWFSNNSKGGASLVGKLTRVYALLTEGSPKRGTGLPAGPPIRSPRTTASNKPVAASRPPRPKAGADDRDTAEAGRAGRIPSIHFNVQVHISPDASPEQVEQIFASMGKHLKQLSS